MLVSFEYVNVEKAARYLSGHFEWTVRYDSLYGAWIRDLS